MNSVFRVLCLVAAAAAASVSHAITLTPTDDTYVRSGSSHTGVPHDEPLVTVAAFSSRRTALFQFDLSSVPGTITGAVLRLSAAEDGATMAADGYLFAPTSEFPKMDETNMTRDLLISDYAAYEIGPTALGTFSISDSVDGQYYTSTAADADDLVILNAIRDANNSDDRHLIIEVYGADGAIDFYSKENVLDLPPQLVLTVPGGAFDEGDFNQDGNVTIDDYTIMRANWLATGQTYNLTGDVAGPGGTGELFADGIIDLYDFKHFKNDLYPGGAAAFAAALAIPEPSTVLLLLAVSPAWLALRVPRRKTGRIHS